MINLKIQLPGRLSTKALIESGPQKDGVLTFHAFSDTMKARILESFARGVPMVVTVTNEAPRTGEWLEKLAVDKK